MSNNGITEAELLAVRQAIIKVLGLPRPGVACLFIIAEANVAQGQDRQRMGCLGLTEFGVMHVLARGLETAMAGNPDVVATLYPTPQEN